ncbi:hypothetical protein ACFLV7_02540 [Chloroflexota bacterium]
MTVVDACEEVGISRSTYYNIIKNNPEDIAEYQEMVEANAKEQLGMILLHKIIEDGLAIEIGICKNAFHLQYTI